MYSITVDFSSVLYCSAAGGGLTNIMENHTFVPRAHYFRLLRRRRRYEPQYHSVLRLCSEFRDSRRSRWRACPRRIVIITSLKNNHMLDEQLYTTGSCVLQTDRRHFSKDLLSLFFSRDFWYTIDGYTYAHFVMTGTSGTHDGNGCRLNIHIEHSL